MARHYASGDLFLFPSVTETFGNVVTERKGDGSTGCSRRDGILDVVFTGDMQGHFRRLAGEAQRVYTERAN